jgi:septal ring factor EnvC (AmiA/AmiB activator)
MTIETTDLTAEREVLAKDFEALSLRIKQVDAELIQMKSNLNAVHGAIQQVDKLIAMSEKQNKGKMPKEKEEALAIATS